MAARMYRGGNSLSRSNNDTRGTYIYLSPPSKVRKAKNGTTRSKTIRRGGGITKAQAEVLARTREVTERAMSAMAVSGGNWATRD